MVIDSVCVCGVWVCVWFSFYGASLSAESEQCLSGQGVEVV